MWHSPVSEVPFPCRESPHVALVGGMDEEVRALDAIDPPMMRSWA